MMFMESELKKRKLFISMAAGLARYAVENGLGGPFGAVVVKNWEVVGEGYNMVTSSNDPTAHAEVVAIRDACRRLSTFQLTGCEIYSSCEPCPMCLGAIYWARPLALYYGSTRNDAASAGFDDEFIYREIALPFTERKIPFVFLDHPDSAKVFELWKSLENKIKY